MIFSFVCFSANDSYHGVPSYHYSSVSQPQRHDRSYPVDPSTGYEQVYFKRGRTDPSSYIPSDNRSYRRPEVERERERERDYLQDSGGGYALDSAESTDFDPYEMQVSA